MTPLRLWLGNTVLETFVCLAQGEGRSASGHSHSPAAGARCSTGCPRKMEGRLNELTAAVDSGDLRQALRVANQQLLRLQKQLHTDPAVHLQQLLVKSIKVIILFRQGKNSKFIYKRS